MEATNKIPKYLDGFTFLTSDRGQSLAMTATFLLRDNGMWIDHFEYLIMQNIYSPNQCKL